MAAEKALRQILADAGGVTALVAERISPIRRQEGDPLPAIVYRHIGGASAVELAGPIGWVPSVYQINCWATDNLKASELAAAVKTALNVINTTVAGLTIDHIRILDEGDVSVLAAGNDALEISGKRLDIRIAYRE